MKPDIVQTNASKLAKRLSEKRKEEAIEIERTTLEALSKLGKSIAGKSSESLNTTRTDIEKSITDLKTFTLKTWAQVGLAIGVTVLIVAGGGWSLLSYESKGLSTLSEREAQAKADLEAIDQSILERQATLSALPKIRLTQDSQGNRYLMLRDWQAGTPVRTGPNSMYVPISPIVTSPAPPVQQPAQTYK